MKRITQMAALLITWVACSGQDAGLFNGDFECGGTPWRFDYGPSTGVVHWTTGGNPDGHAEVFTVDTPNDTILSQGFEPFVNTPFVTLRFDALWNGGPSAFVRLRGEEGVGACLPSDPGWQTYKISRCEQGDPSTRASFYLLGVSDGTQSLRIDNVCVRPSTRDESSEFETCQFAHGAIPFHSDLPPRCIPTITACPDACQADIDSSGDVGFSDILQVIAFWGPCGSCCPEDLNGNGTVDFADILAVIGAWGPCP